MRDFETAVEIGRDLSEVMNAFWRLETWPTFTRHVRQIDIHYEDGNVQVLSMHVDSRGKRDVFKTVRIRQPDVIHYFQPIPPPTLLFHRGSWEFAEIQGGTKITCRHSMVVNPTGCQQFFLATGKILSESEATDELESLIRHNSNETMNAVKRQLEQGTEAAVAP
ncbi:SRPBCC family protein [Bradyrhizobium barranii]